eukprot:3214162-Prymnesium_polylepis.1
MGATYSAHAHALPSQCWALQFRLKTSDRAEPYTLTVLSYDGEENGQHWFTAEYKTRIKEKEKFSKENLLVCLLDDSAKKEALYATDAGQLPCWPS